MPDESGQVTIRPFLEADFQAVSRILAESFCSKIHSLTGLSGDDAVLLAETAKIFPERPIDGYFVAEYEGVVAGALLLKFTGQKRPENDFRLFGAAKKCGFFRVLKLVLGFMLLEESVRPGECYIEFLATGSDFRKKGIGSALICHAGEYAADNGFSEFTLYVASKNPAGSLYEKLGFTEESSYKSLITKFIFGIDRWVYMMMPVFAQKDDSQK